LCCGGGAGRVADDCWNRCVSAGVVIRVPRRHQVGVSPGSAHLASRPTCQLERIAASLSTGSPLRVGGHTYVCFSDVNEIRYSQETFSSNVSPPRVSRRGRFEFRLSPPRCTVEGGGPLWPDHPEHNWEFCRNRRRHASGFSIALVLHATLGVCPHEQHASLRSFRKESPSAGYGRVRLPARSRATRNIRSLLFVSPSFFFAFETPSLSRDTSVEFSRHKRKQWFLNPSSPLVMNIFFIFVVPPPHSIDKRMHALARPRTNFELPQDRTGA
jgi:hypothetical protein